MRCKLLLCLSVLLLFGCTKKNEDVANDEVLISEELVVKNVETIKDSSESGEVKDDLETFVQSDKKDVSNKKEEMIINTPLKENTFKQEEISNKVDTTVKEEVNQHKHQFNEIKETIYHDEIGHYEKKLITEGWIEEIPIYETTSWMQCNQCGYKMNSGTDIDAHYKASFDCSGWTDYSNRVVIGKETIEHEPVYESVYVIDQEAYSENIIIGYQCVCGERK